MVIAPSTDGYGAAPRGIKRSELSVHAARARHLRERHRCTCLYYVATDPTARGAGFGRQMVLAAEDWLRRRGG
jgi:GNAT superfamily N-acetyltransferase